LSLKPFYNFYAKVNKAFPEYKLIIDSVLVKEHCVSVCYTIRGTQKGYFLGRPPSEENLTITGVDFFRLENDLVIEYRDIVRQMSALPPQFDKIQTSPSTNLNPENQVIYTFNKKS
jgi:predicted ester cyclase